MRIVFADRTTPRHGVRRQQRPIMGSEYGDSISRVVWSQRMGFVCGMGGKGKKACNGRSRWSCMSGCVATFLRTLMHHWVLIGTIVGSKVWQAHRGCSQRAHEMGDLSFMGTYTSVCEWFFSAVLWILIILSLEIPTLLDWRLHPRMVQFESGRPRLDAANIP